MKRWSIFDWSIFDRLLHQHARRLQSSRGQKPAIKSKIEYLFAMDAVAVDYHFVPTHRKTNSRRYTDSPDKGDIKVAEPA